MTQIKFVKEIPIINGTYKKDTPDKEIGYQKWQVRKTYEVEMEYEIVAKTKKEADEEPGEQKKEDHCECGLFVRDLTSEEYELHKKKNCPPINHCVCGLFVGHLTSEQFELHKKNYCHPMVHCVCGIFVGDWTCEKLEVHKDQCRLYQRKQNDTAGSIIDKEVTIIPNVSEEKAGEIVD